MEGLIAEPIRDFIHEDLRQFKVRWTPWTNLFANGV
jgi:hypothetical protein